MLRVTTETIARFMVPFLSTLSYFLLKFMVKGPKNGGYNDILFTEKKARGTQDLGNQQSHPSSGAWGSNPHQEGQPAGLLTQAGPEPLLHPGASRVLQSDISQELSFAQGKKLTFINDHSLFHLWNFF